MFNIHDELKKLPVKPGVYLMKNGNDIIYVGKAIILKNRVKQYFQKTNKGARIEKMVSLITSFEYIVTDSEVEALMLECNLIKLHKPKFNVMLKDDKTYPYIKITNEDYPVVAITRRVLQDGAQYFGPYMDNTHVKQALRFIKEKYQVRQCKGVLKSKKRPCINYQIGRCMAPCKNNVSKEEYMKMINEVSNILSGNIQRLITSLTNEMNEYSENLEFEKASIIRDKIVDINSLLQKQKVANFSENDIDVIGVYKKDKVCVQIFFVRNHKLIGRENYFFDDLVDMEDSEIVASFIKQYYNTCLDIPAKIMLRYDIQDKSIIDFLIAKKGGKVEIRSPKKGEKLRFVEMAEKNAQISLENKYVYGSESIIEQLSSELGLDYIPKRIESFDISNISGTNIVGGMVVIEDGNFKKSKYRKFKIQDIFDQDDSKCMKQILDRRLNEAINKKNEAFLPLPDLILADGGIIQINAVKEILKKYKLDIPVYGMVKDNKHRTKAMLEDNNNEIQISDVIMKYITNIQDEVHNYSITYHRNLRNSKMTVSILDDINGIGESKRKALLKYFRNVENIKNASIEEILKVKGINKKLAVSIKKRLGE
ncbi:MAG: excinuclease ABC subunit UvrC [Clostridia bacterium]|nr:excinuclease ABC subunit UvrC [Clostridia bacterium]